MKTWSLSLAVEAALCAGLHTLGAPLLLFAALAPMEWLGVIIVLGIAVGAAFALAAYWKLALATVERKAFRFGLLYWCGVAGALVVLGATTFAPKSGFWLLVMAPPLLSGLHFSYLQVQRARSLGFRGAAQ